MMGKHKERRLYKVRRMMLERRTYLLLRFPMLILYWDIFMSYNSN